MKRLLTGLVLCAMAVGTAFAAEPPAAWTAMQKLAGDWDVNWNGKPSSVNFKLISDGSALMETQTSENMVTMYHLDNGKLMMTHYCAAHNQPRMVADASPDGKTITFKFLDATNLASPDDGHMDHVVIAIEDDNHISETWSFLDHGKMQSETFHLTRKK